MLIRQINGIEDLERAATGVDFDPVQLGAGRVHGELIATPLVDGVLNYGLYQGCFGISGAFCNRNLTFGILMGCGESTFCSFPIEPGAFCIFPAGSDHQAVYLKGVERLMITIPLQIMEQAAEDNGYVLGRRALTTANIYQPPEIWGRYLRQQAREIVEQLRDPCEPEDQALLARDIRDHLIRVALASLASTGNAERKSEDLDTNGAELLKETHHWLYAHKGRPCLVEELAVFLNVSRRTLFRTFENETGMPPGRYMKDFRMSQVRRQLATDRRGNQTIKAAATDWGFWQLGQFANDYRNMFGELPSHTLQKTR